MKKKVIVFNGPPGSGKDYAVRAVGATCTKAGLVCAHNKIIQPVKEAVHKLFGMTHGPDRYDVDLYRAEKEQPLEKLFGLSPRQAYIWMSNDVLKPTFGDDVLGLMAANVMKGQHADVHAFSDGGFLDEWLPITDLVGPANVLFIEIHATRDGKALDYNGDSRSYIGDSLVLARPAVTLRKIHNEFGDNNDRELFRGMVIGVANKFLGLD